MQSNPNTRQMTPVGVIPAPAQKPGAAQRLEQVRHRVRFALRAAEEGPLTVSTADDIARSLTGVMRDLEALQLTIAVMERKEERANG